MDIYIVFFRYTGHEFLKFCFFLLLQLSNRNCDVVVSYLELLLTVFKIHDVLVNSAAQHLQMCLRKITSLSKSYFFENFVF